MAHLQALRGKANSKQQALWMSRTKLIKLIPCAPQLNLSQRYYDFQDKPATKANFSS